MTNRYFLTRIRADARRAPAKNRKSNQLTHNLLDYLRERDIFATVDETDTPRSN